MVGFPHSDIRGSKIALVSPRLFAECHVLHRLLSPRHPPDALNVFLILCACIILPIIHETFVSVKSISLICSIYPSFFRMIVYHVKLKTIFKHQKIQCLICTSYSLLLTTRHPKTQMTKLFLFNSYVQRNSGGDKEDRTPDLRVANASLSQLSYIPITL